MLIATLIFAILILYLVSRPVFRHFQGGDQALQSGSALLAGLAPPRKAGKNPTTLQTTRGLNTDENNDNYQNDDN